MTTRRSARRRHLIAAGCALALGAALVGQQAGAAPSPSSLTLTVGGGAKTFSGGPITGSADASGSLAPVVCSAPACESIPATISPAVGFPPNTVDLTVTVTFTAAGGNPAGLTGLDVWVLDSGGNTVASATLGSSPAVATGTKLPTGAYTIEITGEAGAVQEAYTGSAVATQTGNTPPVGGVTQSPVPIAFGPAAVVSPSILGAEPQISFERPVASPKKDAGLDPARGFVDWPVSSRSQIGTLWRTLNGGESYRQLVDMSCAPRQVPNCYTGGGGDTVNRVNNYDGTVNFGDQESLAQEAFASSVDHGDSFPLARQTPVTSAATGVDRQWISTVDAGGVMTAPAPNAPSYELEAVYSYHIPLAGELVAGVGTDGIVRPAVPVIPGVSQSGPSRIDVQPGSPGNGYFYQGFRDGTGFKVGVAPLARVQDPTAYKVQVVPSDVPQVFPWINLDRQGNLYATWVAPDGQLYYSFSRINDAKNNPHATPAGVPGTTWSPKLKVNAPSLGSTIFPEVVAGDAGHIAIAYDATTDYTGISDNAPTGTHWNTFVSTSSDALDSNPVFQTGIVSHRVMHTGSICTSGTTCTGDRSLLDMIDVTMDSGGRLAVVFTDNNNSFARDQASATSAMQGSPFVKVARLSNGPSLLSGHAPFAVAYPTSYRSSAAGDATWPNKAGSPNLPTLDILGSGASINGTSLVARIDLADASTAGFVRDLAAYNAVSSTDVKATRLQYVTRWDAANGEAYYLAAEVDSAGAVTYFGGKIGLTNAFSNANSAVGVAYRPQAAFVVTGQIQGNSLVITGRLSDFAAVSGTVLYSFAAHSLAGPPDSVIAAPPPAPGTAQIFASMRTVDSSPPLDVILSTTPLPVVPEAPWVALLLVAGVGGAGTIVARRRRVAARAG